MEENYKEPLYPIAIAAKLLKVCPATLRIWEKKGLIKPNRIGRNRFYSRCDIDRLEHIKELIQGKHVNIEGVKQILSTIRCWEIKKCKLKERDACPVYHKYGST
ncbi:MAG: MerR family transcriptional regulator [Candidatus Omnitrophica bacterium]|nr:MerR family transcriptional regulator [Candidatus Omnitrophota bacterium]